MADGGKMRLIDDVRNVRESFPGVVLTIGSFDGVHLGHQAILREVAERARRRNGTACVMTMRPHPREFFSPERPPNLLTSETQKARLLEEYGVHVLFVLPFDAAVAQMPAETFIDEMIVRRCQAVEVVVGHDFRFGKDSRGDYEFLAERLHQHGAAAAQVPPVHVAGERISSTLIRECLLEGDLERAAQLLGRHYTIAGQVVSGRGIGAGLGYPTANIKPDHSAVPAHGVYAALARVARDVRPAAINIGIAPTISHEDLTIEAHILGLSRQITGKFIEIEFFKRLRPERRFPEKEALVAQIAQDVQSVRAFFDRLQGQKHQM